MNLFIQPKKTTQSYYNNDEFVNVPVNITLVKTILKRNVPFSSTRATNHFYVIDFVGTEVSWHFDQPEDRDDIYANLIANNFDYFFNDPSYLL